MKVFFKLKRVLLVTFFCIGALAPLRFSFGQTRVQGSENAPIRTEKIQFDDELVEGELRKPELFYLLQKKQFNYKRLIKLRESFLPEMRRDSEKIPAGRVER